MHLPIIKSDKESPESPYSTIFLDLKTSIQLLSILESKIKFCASNAIRQMVS